VVRNGGRAAHHHTSVELRYTIDEDRKIGFDLLHATSG